MQNRKNARMKTITIRIGEELRIPEGTRFGDEDYAIIKLATETLSGTGLRALRKALAEIITEIEEAGVSPVILSLPPLELGRWLDGCRAYLWHEAVNMELCRLAWQNGIPFIDITTPMLSGGRLDEMLGEDGIQLSRSGEDFVNEVIDRELALM